MQRGQRLSDRFEIERRAGAGGMAEVYRALDLHTGEPVAVKILRRDAPEPTDVTRFEREAAVLAELRHPSIVRYVAHGVAEERRFLAMEWVDGEPLSDRIKGGPLPMGEAITVAAAVADALAAAHRRGVVHRDVKPSNVMLAGGEPRRVKVLDFGVARIADTTHEITLDGAMLGTPGYIAPEQARGEVIDARADVFSLGCLLFRCLTGRPVFSAGDTLSLLLKLVLEEPPRLGDLLPEAPPALDDLVARMLAPRPDQRPADGAAVAAELASIASIASIAAGGARSTPNAPPDPSLTSRERRVACAILARVACVDPARLDAVVAPFGGRVELLADRGPRGSEARVERAMAVTVGSEGAAIDQATRAARCALALRAHLGDAPIALVAGLRDGRSALAEAIDRGVPLLAEAASVIRLDEVAAGLLGTRFDMTGDERGLCLRGERDASAPERFLLGKPTPCVGRDRELRVLEAIFDEAAGEPAARVVIVTGETGVGKSRLRHELVRRVLARGAPVEIWIGRGDPLSARSPFGLIAPAVRGAAGIGPGDPLDVRRKKLRARVGRHVARTDLQRIAEFLGELAGVPFDGAESASLRAARCDPQLMGDQMRRAFEDLLAAECAAQPVLIVLEDLHWGDLPSVRFIDAALKNLAGAPLLVVALARPEVSAVFPDLWSARAPTEIKLGALSPKHGDRLVRAVLGDSIDDATAARVVELSAGNAFYLEELIRAVSEGRREALPETVVAMAQAVLEALDSEARRMLRAASVFGRSFGAAGVAALTGMPRAEVEDRLHLLVEREVVTRRAIGDGALGEGAIGDGEELAFRHAHMREAAYATLTDADRGLGHRLAGAFLERGLSRDPATLAEHFERGGDLLRAVAWYRTAAEQALEANDLARVIAWAQRAFECGAEGEAYGAIRLVEAEANRWLGSSREALLCAIDAVQSLPSGEAAWLRAVSEIAASAMRLGDLASLLRAAEDFGALGEPPAELAVAHTIACTRIAAPLLLLGKSELAGHLMDRAAALAAGGAAGDLAVRARVLETRALGALCAGLSGDFLALAAAAAEGFTAFGDLRNAAVQRANVGSVLASLGAYAEAERELTQVLEISERFGLAQISAAARQSLALALARVGRHDEASAMAAAALAAAREQGNRRLEVGARVTAALIAPDPETAAREALAAVALADAPTPQRAYALAVFAIAAIGGGRAPEAIAAAAEATSILEAAGGMDEGEALVRLADAEARVAAGDLEGARFSLGAARLRLEERASKIPDGALRASFLGRVPENRRTLELCALLGS